MYDVEISSSGLAHGAGACVARVAERVVFVRHALPGERVRIVITEGSEGDRFWRADAVSVSAASPHRVPVPCPVAGPGGCGGCDLQHADLGYQRELKAGVVAEQLRRIGGLDLSALGISVVVSPVPDPVTGDVDGLGWRTRQRYVELPGGGWGMRKHRSHDVVPISECPIAAPGCGPGASAPGPSSGPSSPSSGEVVVRSVETRYGAHDFRVDADGFWQVHPGAPRVLVESVLDLLSPRPGERVLDLYAGVGLFARFLADAVGASPAGRANGDETGGPAGSVHAVEGSRRAVHHARGNLGEDGSRIRVSAGDVARVLAAEAPDPVDLPVDLVVLDPPRAGARREVVEQVARRTPRAVAYVACDPAALARDVTTFASLGYRLRALRAFDLFPMTHHVECVALLTPNPPSRL